MQQTIKSKSQIKTKPDEKILVVPHAELFPDSPWHGIKQVNFDQYLQIISQKKQFLWRSNMENDPQYKQIIPYLVFTHNNKYFLMQRKSTASETRLQNKYSLGIGGHIREEDMSSDSIFEWAKREFHEEVAYKGTLTIKPLGILNDDSNDVGRVHLGFVLLLQGNSELISVKSELKHGQLISLEECKHYQTEMENWSTLVFDLLLSFNNHF